MTYVWTLELDPRDKFVAIALADHCHDDGTEARPSMDLLVRKTGLSENTVRRSLRALQDGEVIFLQRPSSQHRCNVYAFNLPDNFTISRGARVAPLNKSRGATVAGLAKPQGSQMDSQRCQPGAPEVPRWHPNHKEPLIETSDSTQSEEVDLAEVRKRNREIFPSLPKRESD